MNGRRRTDRPRVYWPIVVVMTLLLVSWTLILCGLDKALGVTVDAVHGISPSRSMSE